MVQVTFRPLGIAASVVLAVLASACHTVSPTVHQGPAAIAVTGIANEEMTIGEYRLGPGDILDVNVLYEPELMLDNATVDTNGLIQVPMVGPVRAAGMTAAELTLAIENGLGRYLRDPQVSVNVTEFARQNVTVEGDVVEPGLYPIQGTSSLLQAVAIANGPTKTAKLSEVIVFRTVNGQRMGAVFDLRRIRYGYDPDPLVLGGDVIVVGYSEVKGAFRDFLGAAPVLAVFRPY
jgi:polysaccharide biosynthesis/export protein